MYVFDYCSALQSRVDFELPEEYQEPSSAQFEQQENFEEGKYNTNYEALKLADSTALAFKSWQNFIKAFYYKLMNYH